MFNFFHWCFVKLLVTAVQPNSDIADLQTKYSRLSRPLAICVGLCRLLNRVGLLNLLFGTWKLYRSLWLIVIVISKLSKRHSKSKRGAPAYSRALRKIIWAIQRIVYGRSRSVCQLLGRRRSV